MTPDVVRVEPLPDFLLRVDFVTGERRLFDMKPYLGYPVFSPLRENNLFMCAHVVNGTAAWGSEIDMAPETLYLRGEALTER